MLHRSVSLLLSRLTTYLVSARIMSFTADTMNHSGLQLVPEHPGASARSFEPRHVMDSCGPAAPVAIV